MIDLRAQLYRDFGIDFPISGGAGGSIDDPIVLVRRKPNDYVAAEYGILRCIGIGRGVEWKIIEQALMSHQGRQIDRLKIETKQATEAEATTQIENYYFDVTDCLGRGG